MAKTDAREIYEDLSVLDPDVQDASGSRFDTAVARLGQLRPAIEAIDCEPATDDDAEAVADFRRAASSVDAVDRLLAEVDAQLHIARALYCYGRGIVPPR